MLKPVLIGLALALASVGALAQMRGPVLPILEKNDPPAKARARHAMLIKRLESLLTCKADANFEVADMEAVLQELGMTRKIDSGAAGATYWPSPSRPVTVLGDEVIEVAMTAEPDIKVFSAYFKRIAVDQLAKKIQLELSDDGQYYKNTGAHTSVHVSEGQDRISTAHIDCEISSK